MAEVTNPSAGAAVVPFYGLRFEAGETKTVDDKIAATLGAPLVVNKPADTPTPAPADTPAAPAPAAEQPAEQPAETPAAPAEGNAQ